MDFKFQNAAPFHIYNLEKQFIVTPEHPHPLYPGEIMIPASYELPNDSKHIEEINMTIGQLKKGAKKEIATFQAEVKSFIDDIIRQLNGKGGQYENLADALDNLEYTNRNDASGFDRFISPFEPFEFNTNKDMDIFSGNIRENVINNFLNSLRIIWNEEELAEVIQDELSGTLLSYDWWGEVLKGGWDNYPGEIRRRFKID